MTRNHSIDAAKGGLILLVVLGHAIQGTLEGNFARFFIYSMHMPLFIFISGYLLSVEKMQTLTFGQLVRHYARRMLGWWAIAWVVFTPLALYDDLSWQNIAHYIANPYYHLWYVPTLFFFILLVYVLLKAIRTDKAFYGVLIAASLLIIALPIASVHTPSFRAFDYHFLPYFTMGLCARNVKRRVELTKVNGGVIVWIVYTLTVVGRYFFQAHLTPIPVGLLANVLLIAFWLLPCLKADALPRSKPLEYMGRNSLQIYLWHALPIVVLRHFVYPRSGWLYYGLSALLLLAYLAYVARRCMTQIETE